MGTHSRTGSCRAERDGISVTKHGYLPVPRLIQWMATLQCGLCCEHCLAVAGRSGLADMPLEMVRSLIDQIAEMGVPEFLITGGEPLARDDLGEVIDHVGRKQINWTLNTAAFPNAVLRTAIERYKPGFVAVSLDGPESVHDSFRGKAGAWAQAREAIRFFKSLPGVAVCAGTTVTTRNYEYLEETFHLVVATGVDQWGIHLLVPEGRAAERRDLFLSKSQLKQLVKFVARKRRYFHVTMADEIGYLGSLEPLVRDRPLRCGAGTSHCVVLPDGHVVPCTTLDRSCSAGNIYERPLADIWARGFEEIRQWRAEGKCQVCDYAVACRGGCWLQRKAGKECFKSVWHVPGVLKTAAGIAICLGTLAVSDGGGAQAALRGHEGMIGVAAAARAALNEEDCSFLYSEDFNEAIVSAYAEQVGGWDAYSLVVPPDPDACSEVALDFFYQFYEGTLPDDINSRCNLVHGVLESEQVSLSLAALLWRTVQEPFFDASLDQTYTSQERQAIGEALRAIKRKADLWRLIIFENYLDPYLRNGREAVATSVVAKGGSGRGIWLDRDCLSKDVNEERWGVGEDPDTWQAALAYLLGHPYTEQMVLSFQFPRRTSRFTICRGDGSTDVLPSGDVNAQTMGLFDVIVTEGAVSLQFEINGTLRTLPSSDDGQATFLDDSGSGDDMGMTVGVTLEGGREYTYVELLNAIHENKRYDLASVAASWMISQPLSFWGQEQHVVMAVNQNGPLLWPVLREARETGVLVEWGRVGRNAPGPIEIALGPEELRRVLLKDIDFWMF